MPQRKLPLISFHEETLLITDYMFFAVVKLHVIIPRSYRTLYVLFPR